MKKHLRKTAIILIINIWLSPTFAQIYVPLNGFAIEVSLENTDLLRLPIYQNSISSLKVIDDYIVGGTSAERGLSPYVFVASLSKQKLIEFKDISKVINGQQSIQSGFYKGKEKNTLFAGTMPTGSNNNKLNGSGHLIQLEIDKMGTLDIKDLGIPILGEGIYSLISNSIGTMLYGISYPTGLFFSYNIETGYTRIFKNLLPSDKDINDIKTYILEPRDYLCRSLIQDNNGLIYGSLPINKLFYFNPKDESFHIMKNNLPEVRGRKMLGRVDSWTKSTTGKLYGGAAGDGLLFEIDPYTKKVKNLGKPIMMNRIRGLAMGKDNKLYGVAGAPLGYTHFFSYDEKNGFHDFGIPQFKMAELDIGWIGYNINTITSSEDGKYIIMGEDESLSQLLIYKLANY